MNNRLSDNRKVNYRANNETAKNGMSEFGSFKGRRKHMGSKKILTIKDWLGTGTGSINIEVADFLIERFGSARRIIQKLTVSRKPDQYSSRLGMMANLNKNSRSLSWGFVSMTLTVDEFSDAGVLITRKTFNFTGIAVENTLTLGEFEVVTFVFNQKGEICIGQC